MGLQNNIFSFVYLLVIVLFFSLTIPKVNAASSLFKRIEKAEHQFGDYFQLNRNDNGMLHSMADEMDKSRYD